VNGRFPPAGIEKEVAFLRFNIRAEAMLTDGINPARNHIVRKNRYTTLGCFHPMDLLFLTD
jgi:hypothetical protein